MIFFFTHLYSERITTREEEGEDAKRSIRQYFVSFLDSNIHEFNKYRFSDEMTTIKVRYDVLGGIKMTLPIT